MLEISTARPQRAREHGAGTAWESVHHDSGVRYSIRAGMVVVAGTTPDAGHRLQRADYRSIMRHVDAGYPRDGVTRGTALDLGTTSLVN